MSSNILSTETNTVNNIKYGFLYNWWAVSDERNIANTGWHVPTAHDDNSPSSDIHTFLSYISGLPIENNISSVPYAYKLKEVGTESWESPNTNATNEFKFNAKASLARFSEGLFINSDIFGTSFNMWSSSPGFLSNSAYYLQMIGFNASEYLTLYGYGASVDMYNKKSGLSVRLIKDSTTLTHGQVGVYIGNNGIHYRTICIGTQEWVADNLVETKYRNGDAIPEVTDNTTWVNLTTGAQCAFNNDYRFV
jgi:uncharacterized protein (TIGR02145 family)